MKIPYNRQKLSRNDILSVTSTLNSKFLTTGPQVKKFENEISKFCGSKYSLAVSSGTAALDCALKAINLKKGDNIIVPIINFVALANCLKSYDVNVFFSDVDKLTGQATPELLDKCIKKNKLKKIKAFFVMYLGGASIDTFNF